MNSLFRHSLISTIICVVILLIIVVQQPVAARTYAQSKATPTPTSASKPPFQLPFADPPGPNTWLMAQPYGNTTGAYFQRNTLYRASGGIHFGLDLAAPCGTDIVAIADGVVFQVDGPFGSPPHNLMIDHPQLEYSSMYGHLLEAPDLRPGQIIKQGDVIAKVGDSAGDCNRSPHVHLEIRDLRHFRKFNPITLIDADWNKLALYSSWGRGFMRDLDEPRKWQNLYDQPQAQVGGPIINDFERTWPMDWSRPAGDVDSNTVGAMPTAVKQLTPSALDVIATPLPLAQIPAPLEQSVNGLPANVRQIITGECCTKLFWSPDSTEVRFVDQPSAMVPVGVWGVNVTQPNISPYLVRNRLGIYNQDETLLAYPARAKGLVFIENVATGERWTVDTQENGISFTPDGRILWTEYDSEVEWRARKGEVWIADVDGDNATLLAELDRGGPVAWMSDTELLIARRIRPKQDILLSTLSIEDGTLKELVQLPRTRGSAFSPDKRYMVYLVRFNADPGKNGIWLLDLQDPKLKPQPLPFFGAYRWRDSQHLVYIPFDPEAGGHIFYEYDAVSGETFSLFPRDGSVLNLAIANNDWQISPDGTKIALLATKDSELDGIWVIDIAD